VEGAGGLLVPLNWDGKMMIDLIAKLDIPVILVARSSLGTINHTLLSIEALRQWKIPILGVILNGKPNAENAKSITIFGSNFNYSFKILEFILKLKKKINNN